MKKNLPIWMWGAIAVLSVILLGVIDRTTGYELNFFVFYFVPVSLAAWFIGLSASVWLGVLSAVVWFGADVLSGNSHSSQFYAVWNTMVRLASFVAIGVALSRIRQLLDRQRKLVGELERSLSEVRVLEGFLPICCQCKRIRDQEGCWQQLEVYISERSNTQFSHGYCPECARKAMEEAGLIKK